MKEQLLENDIKDKLAKNYQTKIEVSEYFNFCILFLEDFGAGIDKRDRFSMRFFSLYFDSIINKLIRTCRGLNFIYEDEDKIEEQTENIKESISKYIKKSIFTFKNYKSKEFWIDIKQDSTSLYYEIVSFRNDFENKININRTDNERFFEFYNFYSPDISNKKIVVDLITEAIELINSDYTLNSKAKNRILKQLNEIMEELKCKKTHWTSVFGRMKETIIVLGAIGSLVGGLNSISTASAKLEQAEKVLFESSINNNYFVEENFTNVFVETNLNTNVSLPSSLLTKSLIEKRNDD